MLHEKKIFWCAAFSKLHGLLFVACSGIGFATGSHEGEEGISYPFL